MPAKLRIKLSSCKVSPEDGIKLLEKCGFSNEKAKEIMQSIPKTIAFKSASNRYRAFRLLQNGFDVKLT